MEVRQIPPQDPARIVACILDIGELLLTSGAEVMRVEDTVGRLCAAYGFIKSDVFTITSDIILTATAPDGAVITQSRRVLTRSTDLNRVERINALSRRVVADPLPADAFRAAIEQERPSIAYAPCTQLLLYGAISAVFSVFFGGDALDALAAFCSGLVLFAALQTGSRLRMNSILLSTLCSAVTALAVVGLTALGLGHHADKIIIGNIMLLIPGLALTTSLRDMISGDTLSALMGFSEALIRALGIAIGSALILTHFGG